MISAINAIKASLETLTGGGAHPLTVRVGDATGTPPPFAVIWGAPGGIEDDRPMRGNGGFQGRVGVTATAANTEVALRMADDIIGVLTPGREPGALHAPGRHIQVALAEVHPVQIDRSITLPNSNSYPAYVVVLFDVISQPKG